MYTWGGLALMPHAALQVIENEHTHKETAYKLENIVQKAT